MYFEDLTEYSYYNAGPFKNVLNVGWLDGAHAYSAGHIDSAVSKKLAAVILGTKCCDVHVNRIRGVHECSICGQEVVQANVDGQAILLGFSEIWIPAKFGFYAAPSMILHYILDHNYSPSVDFQEAVLELDLDRRYAAQEEYDHLVASKREDSR